MFTAYLVRGIAKRLLSKQTVHPTPCRYIASRLMGVDNSSTRVFGCSSFDFESFGDFLTKDKAETLLNNMSWQVVNSCRLQIYKIVFTYTNLFLKFTLSY